MLHRRTIGHALYAFALGCLAIVASPAGCGGSNAGYVIFAGDAGGISFDGTTSSSGSSGGSSNGSSGDDGAMTCPSACSSDQECQTACPPVQGGGTNCCD